MARASPSRRALSKNTVSPMPIAATIDSVKRARLVTEMSARSAPLPARTTQPSRRSPLSPERTVLILTDPRTGARLRTSRPVRAHIIAEPSAQRAPSSGAPIAFTKRQCNRYRWNSWNTVTATTWMAVRLSSSPPGRAIVAVATPGRAGRHTRAVPRPLTKEEGDAAACDWLGDDLVRAGLDPGQALHGRVLDRGVLQPPARQVRLAHSPADVLPDLQ